MKLRIPALKDIHVVSHSDGKAYLPIDPLFAILEQHRTTQEKPIRKDVFKDSIKRSGDIQIINNCKFSSLSSVIKLCYGHSSKHSGCAKVCSQLEKLLTTSSVKDDQASILSLYKKIAAFDFNKSQKLWEFTNKHFSISSKNIPTIFSEHEDHFNKEDWVKICLFEWHFGLSFGTDLNYDEQVKQKNVFYSQLLNTVQLAKSVRNSAHQTIQRRSIRHQLSSHDEVILHFNDNQQHCPSKIEPQLQHRINHLIDDFSGTVFLLNCTRQCLREKHGAHIYIESSLTTTSLLDNVAVVVESFLARKHMLPTASILFFKHDSFPEGSNRFSVRDMVLQGKLNSDILCEWTPSTRAEVTEDFSCETCFGEALKERPLHWKSLKGTIWAPYNM